MSRTLQLKRYANTVVANTTGATGELIVDLTNKTLTVHDSITPGGSRIATETYVLYQVNTTNILAQSAFNQANSANVLAQSSFNQANSANVLAQSAFNQANSANTLASTKLNTSGGTITGNVTITGDLTISGNLTSFAANNIVIDDSIIYLANNNSANVIDIGIVGHYVDSKYQHTGLVRDASDGKWKLFSNVTSEPTTTVDFTNATYETLKVGIIEAANVIVSNNDILSYSQTIFNAANAAAQTIPQNPQATNYTLQLSDAGKHIYYKQASNSILYIPTTANVTFSNGTTIMIVSRTTSSANVTITPNVGVSLYLAGNTTSASRNVITYGIATLLQVEANTWMIYGNGVT
jgi:hypothetical protein